MFGELPVWGLYVRHVDGISLKNVNFKLKENDFRPSLIFDKVQNLEMDKITLPKANHKLIILN